MAELDDVLAKIDVALPKLEKQARANKDTCKLFKVKKTQVAFKKMNEEKT